MVPRRVHQEEPFGLLVRGLLQARCSSCHLTNSVKTMKGLKSNSKKKHSVIVANFNVKSQKALYAFDNNVIKNI